ncbi:type VI secretion system ATPase TssH [Deltaproteobacteria bacterium Smac51]|nr:type VI secretion system ATPase TssH [Deltaproteobacteria bacterium Smac51]
MINMNLSALVRALDNDARTALEGAAEACVSRGGHEIGLEDYFEKIALTKSFQDIAEQFQLNIDTMRQLLEKGRPREGRGSGRPVFSTILVEFLQEAYLLATLEMGRTTIDIGVITLTLLTNPARYGVLPFFAEVGRIPADKLRRLLEGLDESAAKPSSTVSGGPSAGPVPGGALSQYATDLTAEAKNGRIDPVLARGDEIRQVVDILTRRRKNNPILVGDPGVGKTAVAEGLALKIALGEVPDVLLNVRLVALDMGRLSAGASVKGEFEKRLKAVIDEVKASPSPMILFIDEAHTLVGAGNASGAGDASNLLKPALARGELRTLAATTWSEYKKYFEKDAALARRFQLVKLDEPSTEQTITILRGLVPHYEKSHKVYVSDEAVVRIAELSARYISGRYLPDKAIDVLDTACARVKVSQGAKPAELEILEEELATCQAELSARERDIISGGAEQSAPGSRPLPALRAKIAELNEAIENLKARWVKEKELVRSIVELRTGEPAPPSVATDEAGMVEQAEQTETPPAETPPADEPVDRKVEKLLAALKEARGDHPLVFSEVNVPLVTELVSEWTGIPREKLEARGGEVGSIGAKLRQRVRGQDAGLAIIEKSLMTVFSGLENPGTPGGIFLLVGPSGVGKTETALAVAEEVFGGERFLISVNMSEFQEKHTVSRLIGSPPGYVGYGEGGRLTEAVRRQPYSAVLFDEVEKAHPDILNLFYQMFDKGVLADGEGRDIDFKNTMIFMTSNLGGDIISALWEEGERPSPKMMTEAVRPALSQLFKPALLGRLTIVPFAPLDKEVMAELVTMKLSRLAESFHRRHRLSLTWDPAVIDSVAGSCTAVDTGARNIDHVMNAALLPELARHILGRPGGKSLEVRVSINDGAFSFA